MSQEKNHGVIIRSRSGFYTVRTPSGEVTCQMRGRLKEERLNTSLVAVGDKVTISVLPDGSGVIESILPREKEFFRMAPTARGEFKQIMLANPDQVVLVFACASPAPSFRMLDRFLVITEKQQIPVIVVANKTDLIGQDAAKALFSVYPELGYRVIFTSAKEETGIDELKRVLIGKVSALSGPSGVGKSSLLNRIQPKLGLKIGTVKEFTQKGRHTTVVRELLPLDDGGFVADMPGLRTLSLWDTQPEELDGYFPELRDLVTDCQFSNCSHISEPGCAVKKAVESGKVNPQRYESYVRLRLGDS
ncbi:MAG: ribosome small subunit-dependent GTPase A [Pelolinea sp.]|nr:ribosome small subunit-dependent GTPase A [Pelolinea sp.]